ncbi:hypothetical protein ACJRO7_000347 [Eucalyptus globulus]|uniref:Pectinesterase inhibitor domain-containing protein n=1 Tax=Eucalyptus globulus TaxID=34317 RepID=A0ABD3LRJ1_EUCGL
MENKSIRILLTMSFSFVLLNPAGAICVSRDATTVGPSPSPDSPLNPSASPYHQPSPSPESVPPPPSTAASPQSSQAGPSPSLNSPLDSDASPNHKSSPSPESIPPPPSAAAPSQSSQATDADPPSTNAEATTVHRGSPIQAGAANLALKKVCDTTDYPALCISTLAPFLVGSALLEEPIVLLHAAIKAATAETKLAMMVLGRLIETSRADARTLMILKDCHDNYSDALDNYQAATDAIPNWDIGTINTMLSAAVTDYETCEDEFSGRRSPMASRDNKLSRMADNCLAIASLIK